MAAMLRWRRRRPAPAEDDWRFVAAELAEVVAEAPLPPGSRWADWHRRRLDALGRYAELAARAVEELGPSSAGGGER